MRALTVQVDRNDPLPRHFQVRRILREMVSSGTWVSGEKIPAETEIAESLGVSKMTVNKAILALASEGLFHREVGRGTFVLAPEEKGVPGDRYDNPSAAQVFLQVVTATPPELISDNEYLCALLLAMRSTVSPVDARIVLRHLRGKDYGACLQESGCDGWVIVAPAQEDLPGLRALAAANVKAVVLGADWPEVNLPSIDSDNIGGARLAIDHLASLGHRHIGMLYAEPHHSNPRDRIEGFQRIMRERNMPIRSDWIMNVNSSHGIAESVRMQLRELLQKQDRPTAFFAAGPIIACSLLQVAKEAGISVPEQMSIVGFDDPRAVTEAIPVLTTVRQPLEQMGYEAITYLKILIEQAGGGGALPLPKLSNLKLPCHLLVRGSTAPAMEYDSGSIG
jgi:DNA-binding LacI/PurR family transcriptional regulator/biotin operon repressor